MYNISVETRNKAVTLAGFFISTPLTTYRPSNQPNIFGAKVPAVTLHGGKPPRVAFSGLDNRKSSVTAGTFSYLPTNGTTPDATNTQGRNITRLQRSPMMRRDCTDSASGSQATNLSISQQIKQTQSQVDSLMESIIDKMEVLAGLMRQLQALQTEQENL